MPTPDDLVVRRARQAYWLRIARVTDAREPTLAEVAVAAGLKPGSGSVVSLWERDEAKEGPKQSQLIRLAAYYQLPITLFTEPPATDAERVAALRAHVGDRQWIGRFLDALDAAREVEDRMVGAALAAVALEHADSPGSEAAADPPVELVRAERRRTPPG